MHFTQSIVLEVTQIDALTSIPFEGRVLCERLSILIRAASEATQEATAPDGFWARQPDYHRQRLEHVDGLLDLMDNELSRLIRLLKAES